MAADVVVAKKKPLNFSAFHCLSLLNLPFALRTLLQIPSNTLPSASSQLNTSLAVFYNRGLREPAVNCIDKKILDFGLNWRAATCRTRISMPFEKNEFRLGIEGKSSRGNKEKRRIRMALIDEKVVYGRDTTERPALLEYPIFFI
ncbi:hypothetical protein OIU84_008223 [Salix udensis]|uniref:Uncharacterized protein n=1 Tax=Salix udensis TaxID=889485 RepID=A0AAD6P000_9ROSI|nr:hypothetical protein OIU84_008223 [Salix udensis]